MCTYKEVPGHGLTCGLRGPGRRRQDRGACRRSVRGGTPPPPFQLLRGGPMPRGGLLRGGGRGAPVCRDTKASVDSVRSVAVWMQQKRSVQEFSVSMQVVVVAGCVCARARARVRACGVRVRACVRARSVCACLMGSDAEEGTPALCAKMNTREGMYHACRLCCFIVCGVGGGVR